MPSAAPTTRAGLLAGLALLSSVHACSYTLSPTTPGSACPPVNPNWFGYHYETASWPNFALNEQNQTNQFTANLFQVTTNRTGGVPIIRLGGTDCDYSFYSPGQSSAVTPAISRQYQGRHFNGTTIGPSYWELCSSFDNLGAQYVIQVPIGTQNVSETLAWVESATSIVGDRIQAIEIGNEPNDYGGQKGFGPPEYIGTVTNQSWVDVYLNHSEPVATLLNASHGQRIFQAFDTAMAFGAPDANAWALPYQKCFELGIDRDNQIKQVGHHYYSTGNGTPEDVVDVLLNHTFTTYQLDLFRPFFQFLATAADGDRIPLIMSEYAPSLGVVPGYEDVFGVAVWSVDWQLYAMSLGLDSINYSESFQTYFILWLPIESDGIPAQVYPPFYAFPLVADFIGDSGKTRVVPVDADAGTANESIVAYAAYEDDKPVRMAVLNLDAWGTYRYNGTAETPATLPNVGDPAKLTTVNLTEGVAGPMPRPSVSVTVAVPAGCKQVTVKRLSSDIGAYAGAEDITYGGSQWTYASLGLEVHGVRNDSETLKVQDGQVVVDTPATSVALLFFD